MKNYLIILVIISIVTIGLFFWLSQKEITEAVMSQALKERIEKAEKDEKIPIIIFSEKLKDNPKKYGIEIIEEKSLKNIPIFFSLATAKEIKDIIKIKEIKYIDTEQRFFPSIYDIKSLTGLDLVDLVETITLNGEKHNLTGS